MSYEITIRFPEGMTEDKAIALAKAIQFEHEGFLSSAEAEIFIAESTSLN